MAITLYHELIHAKHDLLNPTSEFHQVMQRGEEISINKYEEDVENEALETFDSYRYSILKLVSEIYTLVIPGCLTHKD